MVDEIKVKERLTKNGHNYHRFTYKDLKVDVYIGYINPNYSSPQMHLNGSISIFYRIDSNWVRVLGYRSQHQFRKVLCKALLTNEINELLHVLKYEN